MLFETKFNLRGQAPFTVLKKFLKPCPKNFKLNSVGLRVTKAFLLLPLIELTANCAHNSSVQTNALFFRKDTSLVFKSATPHYLNPIAGSGFYLGQSLALTNASSHLNSWNNFIAFRGNLVEFAAPRVIALKKRPKSLHFLTYNGAMPTLASSNSPVSRLFGRNFLFFARNSILNLGAARRVFLDMYLNEFNTTALSSFDKDVTSKESIKKISQSRAGNSITLPFWLETLSTAPSLTLGWIASLDISYPYSGWQTFWHRTLTNHTSSAHRELSAFLYSDMSHEHFFTNEVFAFNWASFRDRLKSKKVALHDKQHFTFNPVTGDSIVSAYYYLAFLDQFCLLKLINFFLLQKAGPDLNTLSPAIKSFGLGTKGDSVREVLLDDDDEDFWDSEDLIYSQLPRRPFLRIADYNTYFSLIDYSFLRFLFNKYPFLFGSITIPWFCAPITEILRQLRVERTISFKYLRFNLTGSLRYYLRLTVFKSFHLFNYNNANRPLFFFLLLTKNIIHQKSILYFLGFARFVFKGIWLDAFSYTINKLMRNISTIHFFKMMHFYVVFFTKLISYNSLFLKISFMNFAKQLNVFFVRNSSGYRTSWRMFCFIAILPLLPWILIIKITLFPFVLAVTLFVLASLLVVRQHPAHNNPLLTFFKDILLEGYAFLSYQIFYLGLRKLFIFGLYRLLSFLYAGYSATLYILINLFVGVLNKVFSLILIWTDQLMLFRVQKLRRTLYTLKNRARRKRFSILIFFVNLTLNNAFTRFISDAVRLLFNKVFFNPKTFFWGYLNYLFFAYGQSGWWVGFTSLPITRNLNLYFKQLNFLLETRELIFANYRTNWQYSVDKYIFLVIINLQKYILSPVFFLLLKNFFLKKKNTLLLSLLHTNFAVDFALRSTLNADSYFSTIPSKNFRILFGFPRVHLWFFLFQFALYLIWFVCIVPFKFFCTYFRLFFFAV